MDKKYTKVSKITENPFLNLYKIDALKNNGEPFEYYFVSRNPEEKIKHKTKSVDPEGIVIYPVYKAQPDKIVMIRQYRYPLDCWLYELPAGLIDAGEDAETAAIREMKEETGLEFEPYTGGEDAMRRPFFMGAGFTDETSTTVFGYASGEISREYQEETESIETILVDREEAKRILREERVSLRCAFLLMQFLQMQENTPFRFLDIE